MLGLQLQVRGALVFLQWRDLRGGKQRRVWAPDTLPAAQRRELRLAMQQRAAATMPVSVAG
jgi:toxin CptA